MSQRHSAFLMPFALMIIGLGLIGLGWAWRSVVPSDVYWGPEQAEEYSQAQADLHAKTHAAKHQGKGAGDPVFLAARQRFDKIRQELEGARGARASTGMYLAVAGILLVLVGIGVYLSDRQPG